MSDVHYRTVAADGLEIFYREAGPSYAPVILLLHGFPTSSHMFRNLIPQLAQGYRVIAPDLPGFGFSGAPAPAEYGYTFDRLAKTIEAFTDAIGLNRYALYVFDYGAPVGFRLARARPERVTALISQNGNAYEEGLSEGWTPIQAYWNDPSAANREALRGFLTAETTRWQYEHGSPDPSRIAPEAWTLDQAMLDRAGNADIQLDLFGDYKSNVALYPSFQAYFREHRPPTLAVWGKSDPFFLPPGAEAFRRDNPDAEVHFVDGGHFPLETHGEEIAEILLDFLDRTLGREASRPIPILVEEDAPDDARASLQGLAKSFGFTPNLTLAMAHAPASLASYVAGLQAVGKSLTPAEAQLVMIVASHANHAHYGVAVHTALASGAGADAAMIEAARTGQEGLGDARQQALFHLARLITQRRPIGPADVEGFSPAELVEIVYAVSLKQFANTIAALSGAPVDEALK